MDTSPASSIAGIEVGLPATHEAITAEWLTKVLRVSGAISDNGEVSNVNIQRFTGGGLACAGYKLAVTYNKGSGPRQLFMKMPLDVPRQRALAEAFDVYTKETKWYREIAPNSLVNAPKVYAAMVNLEKTHYCLVMDDMSHLKQRGTTEGVSFDDAIKVIDALAAYHSQWTDSEKLDEVREVFFGFDHPVYAHGLPMLHDNGWEGAKKHVPQVITPEARALGDEWKSFLPLFIERMTERPLTISHGDSKTENFFFDDANGRVYFIDPQLAGVTNVAYDMAIVVGLSMEHAEYKGRAEELVKRYVDVSLSEHKLRLDHCKMMSDMKVALGVCMIYGFSSFGSYEDFTEPMKQTTATCMRRISAAVTEFGVLDELRRLKSNTTR